ncbi:MAG: AMP-dependent synthetase/ligase [candidate division WOR-3 bacterium]
MRNLKVREGKPWVTIPEMFERSAEEWPDRVLFQMKREGGWDKYTYAEALSLVRRLAEFLKTEAGLVKGDRFSIVGGNRPEWGVAYLAIMWAGGIVVPLDPKLMPSERGYILGAAGVKGVIATDHFVGEMCEHRENLKSLETVISMDRNPKVPDYPTIWAKYTRGIPRERLLLDDVAVILFTSGTTGLPKGVVLTHRNIISNVDAMYQAIEYGPGDLFYSVLPLHHVFEATAGFLAPIYGGVTIAYSSSLRPDVMRAELRELRPTVMLVVPLILEKFLLGIRRNLSKLSPGKRLAFGVLRGVSRITDIFTGGRTTRALYKTVREQMGLDRARYMISGGAALPRWVSAGLEEMGFPILQGYGLSEASPVVSVNPPDAPRNASVGIPIQFCEVKIMNPDANRVGEIAVRAPFVMQGYYKNPEATREVITPDGWLLTGDMGYIDSDGYIYITGRKKAVIVTKGGKNIFPEEIEEKLTQSEMISEALVFGAKNPRTGEEDVQAIIYPNMELMGKMGLTDEERIYELVKKEVDAVNARLADYKKIRRFALRFEEFPKTTTVKIKRHLFKNIFIEKGQKVL